MVYCGKPSMGCRTCRTRRIKCDEARPICNQCIKSRRYCSGYRSDFDILHRDETKATEARARKAAAKKAAKKAAENGEMVITFESPSPMGNSPINILPATASSTSTNTSPQQLAFPIAAPAVPIDQQASCYFASQFIMVPGQSKTSGHLEYLLPLLNLETKTNSPLQLAYSACALATMGNRIRSNNTNLLELAFMQHARALGAAHEALKNPRDRNTDATLATVMMLSMFENITASKEIGLLAWRSHIEGAVNIVKSRGRDQVRTKTSLLLFSAVRMAVIARTLSSGLAPAMGVNWWLPESVAADSFGARAQRFNLETSDLRAEVTRLMQVLPRNDHGLELMLEMLRKVQGLDHQIANWLGALPDAYQFKALYWEDRPIVEGTISTTAVFPGRVDVYPDLIVASIWNALRAGRLILASMTIRCAAWICSPADYRTTPEYSTAVGICHGIITDIIASVPFHLGMLDRRRQLYQANGQAQFACGFEDQTKMLGALRVSWPLATCNTHDCTTDEQRAWVQGRLLYISDDLGLKWASSLASSKIRFPSMLIRRDGLQPTQDPLKEIKETLSTRVIPMR